MYMMSQKRNTITKSKVSESKNHDLLKVLGYQFMVWKFKPDLFINMKANLSVGIFFED